MPVRDYSETERTVTGRRRLERPLGVLVWLGIVAFGVAEQNPFYLYAGTAVAGVNLLAASLAREVYLSSRLVNVCVLAATGVLAVELLSVGRIASLARGGYLVPLGHYLILIQLCKLFERRSDRDYAQLLAMSLLQVVAASMLSSQPLLAAILVVHLALACYTAMIFVLKKGLQEVATARLATEAGPLEPQQVAWRVMRVWPGKALRGKLIVALGVMGALGAVMYLAVPRFDGDGGSESGMRGMVRLGRATRVELSDEVLLRVAYSSPPTRPGETYLRGQVFNHYGRFGPGPWSWWSTHSGPVGPPAEFPLEVPGQRLTQRVIMSRRLLPHGYGVYPVVEVSSGPRAMRFGQDGDWGFASYTATAGPVRYAIQSLRPPLTPAQAAALDGPGRLPMPMEQIKVSDRVAELAWTWSQELLGPAPEGQKQRLHRRAEVAARPRLHLEVARHLARKLGQQCQYSLDLTNASEGREAIEDFLFHMGRGHCEYFASAQVAMCHALGIPARLATGFRVDPADREDGWHLVRERDAHAWAEVFDPGRGWVVVEATPAAAWDPAAAPAPSTGEVIRRWLGDLWAALMHGYDAETQRRLWQAVRDGLRAAGQWAVGTWAALREGLGALIVSGELNDALRQTLLGLLVLACLLEAVVIARLVARRVRARRQQKQLLGRQWRQWVRLRRLLAELPRHGVAARADESLCQWLIRGARTLGLDAAVGRDLARSYYAVRWGRQELSAPQARLVGQRLDAFARGLARAKRSAGRS